MGHEKDFTIGSVNRATFLLALPTMLELALESLFVIVNLLFVSSLGDQAIALAGITNAVIIMLYAIPTGLSIAATAIIARRVGEKKSEEAGLVAVQAMILAFVLSGIFTMLMLLSKDPILRFTGAGSEILQAGQGYVILMFCSLLFTFMRTLMNGIFRGAGNAAMSMRALTIFNILNVFFCVLFVMDFPWLPSLGFTGIGLAALLASILSVGYQLWYFTFREARITIGKAQRTLAYGVIKKLFRLAVAGIIQYLVPSLSRFLMVSVVATLGESVLAGYIIANRIIMFTVLPAWGIANASGILTGHNLGAAQPDRAEQSVWKAGAFNVMYLGMAAIIVFFFGGHISAWFTSDPHIIAYAYQYLQFMAVAYFFFGYTMVISKSLNAAGQVNTVTLLYMLMFLGTQLPLAYWLAIVWAWGATGIFLAIAISEIVLTTACLLVFRKGKWKQSKL